MVLPFISRMCTGAVSLTRRSTPRSSPSAISASGGPSTRGTASSGAGKARRRGGRRAVAPRGGRPLPEARRGHAHAGRGAGGDHAPEELRLPPPPAPARTSRASSTAPSTPTSSWTPTPRPNYFMIRTDFPSRDPCVLASSAHPFGHSSNTEGMHLQNTRGVGIKSSSVGCGDDWVSIETGCTSVQIKS
ncbi:hypothetical protein PAHAL_1G075700 [Panicum hallii]|uniref:Uncharacterized protein n=1 Tax=Panicum hallii TaxID=206008 RepID=A0A2T8KUC9_9POAL|nr:hypothetical protein PAHAL_1G075700 [Panicum hallii]